jgi:hypothetical protein
MPLLNPEESKHFHDKHHLLPMTITSWAVWTMHELKPYQGEKNGSKVNASVFLSFWQVQKSNRQNARVRNGSFLLH